MSNKNSSNFIDSHIPIEQCKKAVNALLNHSLRIHQKRQDTELLPAKEENIWLVVAVKKIQQEKKIKPRKIPLAHPLIDPRITPICLITKDPQREYKDLLEAQKIKFISRVVGIEKLKGKFKPFEARRLLLKENGMFLADERIVPLLPGLLGKIFFEAKKQPIPVSLKRTDLKGELERAVSSTYMHQNKGTCTSIKVGTILQTSAQILANLEVALPAIVKYIDGGWDNIQSFNIKTNTSTSLPIWSCDLGRGDGARWPDLLDEETWGGFDKSEQDEDIDSEGNEIPQPKTEGDRKRKRKAADAPGEIERLSKIEAAEEDDNSAQNGRHKKKSKSNTEKVVAGDESIAIQPTTVDIGPTIRNTKSERIESTESSLRKKEKVLKSRSGQKTAKDSIVGRKAKSKI